MPLAVWVRGIEDAKQAVFWSGHICNKSARVCALSSDRTLIFELSTNPLTPDCLSVFQRLSQYGFTVIDVPASWANEYSRPNQWRDTVTNLVLERVKQWHDDGKETAAVYNEGLAREVLTILREKYPYTVNMIDIKRGVADEPSDDELLTALHGLQLEGLITGNALPDYTSSSRKLAAMTAVQITKEGKQYLSGKTDTGAVVHQYNNFGQSGAMGPNAVGTINYQQQWAASAGQFDLAQIAAELQALRAELMKTAKTPADFQQLGLVAEAEQYAEKQDGAKVLEVLSKAGNWLLDFATKVGTDVTAKTIAKSMGLEG